MIRIRGLQVIRGGHRCVDGVDLTIGHGEVVALLGPNGSGKSSLLQAVAGSLPTAGGDVVWDDRPLREWSGDELARKRAVMSQSTHMAFPFTVREVVSMGYLGLRKARDAAVGGAMLKANVLGMADRDYSTLSGGEQQRVQFARAMCQLWGREAKGFLLLDEPTSQLDLAHQHRVLEAVTDFAFAGGGVLIVLHDLNLAAMYADRVALLKGGRLLACDLTREVIRSEPIETCFDVEARIVEVPASKQPDGTSRSVPHVHTRPKLSATPRETETDVRSEQRIKA